MERDIDTALDTARESRPDLEDAARPTVIDLLLTYEAVLGGSQHPMRRRLFGPRRFVVLHIRAVLTSVEQALSRRIALDAEPAATDETDLRRCDQYARSLPSPRADLGRAWVALAIVLTTYALSALAGRLQKIYPGPTEDRRIDGRIVRTDARDDRWGVSGIGDVLSQLLSLSAAGFKDAAKALTTGGFTGGAIWVCVGAGAASMVLAVVVWMRRCAMRLVEADASTYLTPIEVDLLDGLGAARPARSHLPQITGLLGAGALGAAAVAFVHDHHVGFAAQEIRSSMDITASVSTVYRTHHDQLLLVAGLLLGAIASAWAALLACRWVARSDWHSGRSTGARESGLRALAWALAGIAVASAIFVGYRRIDRAAPGVTVDVAPQPATSSFQVDYHCTELCRVVAAVLMTARHGCPGVATKAIENSDEQKTRKAQDLTLAGTYPVAIPQDKVGRLGREVILGVRFVDAAGRASDVEVDIRTAGPPPSNVQSSADRACPYQESS